MKIFITGGTGFIGRRLTTTLLEKGHEPVVLTRSPDKYAENLQPEVTLVGGDPAVRGDWMEKVRETGAAVNLVGETILGRWTASKKERIVKSRLESTRNLVEALSPGAPEGFTLISGSAVGYYGYHGEEILTEADTPGDDFLARLAVSWEGEALKAGKMGARVILLRTGVVLGEGGALGQMSIPFRFFLGGPVGSGKQYISWIHLDDEAGLILFALENPALEGPLNATAPNPVTNAEFSRTLGRVLHRPSVMPAPAFAVRAVLGEFAGAITKGQRVMPDKALTLGYPFLHPELEEALGSILKKG